MTDAELKRVWLDNYRAVPTALQDIKKVEAVATAFNTNIDAVLKISGKRIAELARKLQMSWEELHQIKRTKISKPADVIKGLLKCFEKGIAEEWITEDIRVYNWMMEEIGYERLQMGGQGGIVANALAACGVQKVYAHANSLPEKQAEQFLKLNNLCSFDENGVEKPAFKINRSNDIPLIHWILEFDKGDVFEIGGQRAVCPKSNRFIATYDPLNLSLTIDEAFVRDIENQKLNFVVLSGFHALTKNSGGLRLLNKALPVIEAWRQHCPGCFIHLELASTQDVAVRKAILNKIAPLVDSIGVNEREAIDVLEVIGEEELAKKCEQNSNSVNLFEGLLRIKEKTKCPRIQLHMFGLYITIQNKYFKITPENNRKGMMLAASVAAHKAKVGNIDNCGTEPLWSLSREVSEVGINELRALVKYMKRPNMMGSGITEYAGFEVIVVPTILVDEPVTLVGMGDTISSISLVGSYEEKKPRGAETHS